MIGIAKTTRVLLGGFPIVLAGRGLGGHRSSLGVPGEVILGRQRAHSGSRMSSAAVEWEPILRLGPSGSSIAVESELTCAIFIQRKLFGVVTRAGKMRAAPGKKSLGLRAQEERVERVEEVKRVERVEGTE